MIRHAHLVAAMIIAAGTAFAQQPYDHDAEKAAEEQILSTREKGLFQEIDWKKDCAEARKAAEEQKRPILVFIVVGENAKKDAPDC